MRIRDPFFLDLYELNMMQVYFERRMEETAVFEFFARKLPHHRGFLVAAGLEQVLQLIEGLGFSEHELRKLERFSHFKRPFLRFLGELSFTGDVWAMPEGSVFFPDEPILQVIAPIAQAQWLETRLMNLAHFESVIASKAVRCRLAAPGKLLVDFGMRRAHGAEAGLLAARASYLGGFDGTSALNAAIEFGIPAYGTMAHSLIQACESEEKAFEHFAITQGRGIILLIDTYDTEEGARKVVRLAPALRRRGIEVSGVRLDSGNLGEHARRVRRILDGSDLRAIRIFASSSLDEHEIERLLASGAPIDGFGVGTHLTTSSDAPYLDCAYKIEEYAGEPRLKKSEGKATLPGRKQVWRRRGADGRFVGDRIALWGEPAGEASMEPLLVPVMRKGRRLSTPERLEESRGRLEQQLKFLPPEILRLRDPASYRVERSEALAKLAAALSAREPPGRKTAWRKAG